MALKAALRGVAFFGGPLNFSAARDPVPLSLSLARMWFSRLVFLARFSSVFLVHAFDCCDFHPSLLFHLRIVAVAEKKSFE